MIRYPLAHLAFFVLDRVKFVRQGQRCKIGACFFCLKQITITCKPQDRSAEVYMAQLHFLIPRAATKAIHAFMKLLPLKHMLVDYHLSQCKLVVETSMAVGIGVQV